MEPFTSKVSKVSERVLFSDFRKYKELVAKNVEKGEVIKNSTVDSEEIKKILKENLVTVKTNIKRKKEAIVQLEQEIVDEEGNI